MSVAAVEPAPAPAGPAFAKPRVSAQVSLMKFGDPNAYFAAGEFLGPDSVVYSIGIGADFSFDTDIGSRFGIPTYAFDPTPQSAALYATLPNPGKLRFMNVAVGAADGESVFQVVKDKKNYMSAYSGKGAADVPTKEVRFKVRSVPSLMKQFKHGHIDLFRIDAEGAEFAVLPHLFANNIFPTQIMFEIHPTLFGVSDGAEAFKSAEDLVELVRSKGYEVIHVSRRGTEISFVRSYLL
ncbi:FkbM family methyltransferase [Methylopila turkensis]|nr:FkbM family methyltransferase [Methylopila turkensis]